MPLTSTSVTTGGLESPTTATVKLAGFGVEVESSGSS